MNIDPKIQQAIINAESQAKDGAIYLAAACGMFLGSDAVLMIPAPLLIYVPLVALSLVGYAATIATAALGVFNIHIAWKTFRSGE